MGRGDWGACWANYRGREHRGQGMCPEEVWRVGACSEEVWRLEAYSDAAWRQGAKSGEFES